MDANQGKNHLASISECIAQIGDIEKLKTLVEDAIQDGFPVPKIVEDGLRQGLEEVGKRYEAGEYFLAELLAAASLVEEINQMIKPRLGIDQSERIGRIVLGTVKGDIHDIGKNIFKMLAESAGFEVIDLGVDVDPEGFLNKLRESMPAILAMSALLTTSLPSMKDSIEAIKKSDLGKNVRIILGGNAVTPEFAERNGAYGAMSAVEGVRTCREWVK
jgi:methanogenic corrinoid protein MtbC1